MLSQLLPVGALALHVAVVATAIYYAVSNKAKQQELLSAIAKHAYIMTAAISGLAVLGSLYYSNVIGYPPCPLCWWQRIFMYPLLIISLMAIIKKDKRVTDYLLTLAAMGFLFSLYHYYIEWGGSPLIPCAAEGTTAACSRRYVFAFNYITIPLMALTTFGISAVALWVNRQFSKA